MTPKPKTHEFPAARIITTAGTQPRAQLDQRTITQYTQDLKDADGQWPFPPLILYHDGESHYLADGFHRLAAAKNINRKSVLVTINQGTVRDAILHASGANAQHGLRRTDDDKRRAVQRLLKDNEWAKWSDREIARTCHVSPTFVGKLRADLLDAGHLPTVHADSSTRTYIKQGRVETMQTAEIGSKPIMPDQMRPHVQTYIKNYKDHLGRTWSELDNPAHTNSVFWGDITRYFKAHNIPYAPAGLKHVIKQLHAQARSGGDASQQTAEWGDDGPPPDNYLGALRVDIAQAIAQHIPYSKQDQVFFDLLEQGPDHPLWDSVEKAAAKLQARPSWVQATLRQLARSRQPYPFEAAKTEPNYASIRELETLIRDWLIHVRTGGRTLVVHHAVMESAKKGGKSGTEFNNIVTWMTGRNLFRINDLWQAVNNVHDQMTQQIHHLQQTGQSLSAARTEPEVESEPLGPAGETEGDGPQRSVGPSPSPPQFIADRVRQDLSSAVDKIADPAQDDVDPRYLEIMSIRRQLVEITAATDDRDETQDRFLAALRLANNFLGDACTALHPEGVPSIADIE